MLRFLVCLIAAASALVASNAAAFDLNPVVSVMQIPGDGAGITLTLRNPRTVELPVSFDIVERSIQEDGTEVTTPADDLFVIFPPQAVVAPGQSQGIRVQWLGSASSKSRSFTLFAEEQPIDLTQQEGINLQTVFRIGASIHITHPKALPKPQLVAAVADPKGVRVTLGNGGDRFFYIDELALKFGSKEFAGVDLGNIAVRTLVPPGSKRSFLIPGVSGTPTLSLAPKS